MSINKSFTLIELLVVIAIIGILSGLIIVSLNGANASAQDARTRAGVDSLRKTILAYGIHSGGVYPAENCVITSSSCPALTSALVPDYYSALPDTSYSYTSGGTDFTVSGTLSNSDIYSYTASTGFNTTTPPSGYVSTCVSGGGLTCTETIDGSYVINKYTLSGTTTGTTTWDTPAGVTEVEYLVVAGGGGGGARATYASGGGGGAGGLLTASGFSVSGTLTVTVGAGGAGGIDPTDSGDNGEDSVFSTIIATGGGGGGSNGSSIGKDGGSGGGGAGRNGLTPGNGISGQGNNGGSGGGGASYAAGGGGGAGTVGANGSGNYGAAGGSGTLSSIMGGTSVPYAGGGGGGGYSGGGAGGSGGGGAGGSYSASPGTDGLGGGGGGGGYRSVGNGGGGGSGVVIIRYLHP
jgi:prepilin-type N-terminal cleavage/methylation domain-containing protein